jgi:hypothetical protein
MCYELYLKRELSKLIQKNEYAKFKISNLSLFTVFCSLQINSSYRIIVSTDGFASKGKYALSQKIDFAQKDEKDDDD